MSPELRKSGYYSVGSAEYLSKIEAQEAAVRSNGYVKFHMDDDFWSSQDWQYASSESLGELYRRRLQQIRDKYDYVILAYSSGADSHNILKTADLHNIRLDEIVMWHDLSLSGTKHSKAGDEIHHLAIPLAQAFIVRHPHTRLEVFDIREPLVEIVSQYEAADLARTYLSCMSSIGAMIRGGGWIYTGSRYKTLIDQGKKVCIIWGIDKTLLRLEGQAVNYTFRFCDINMNRSRKRFVHPNFPVYDEDFYHSSDMPELVIKQCHILLSRLKMLPADYVDPFPIPDEPLRLVHILTPNRRKVSMETVNVWLYGYTPPISVGKTYGTQYVSGLDEWVIKCQEEDVVKRWKQAMGLMRRNNQKLGMLPTLWSKSYPIVFGPTAQAYLSAHTRVKEHSS